ncbi:PAAR motif family protein, partial [Yersinia pestis PY-08]
MAPLLVP